MSPELCLSRPYDHKSDVWALGCVLYELTSLRRPFSAQGFAQLIMSVLRGRCAPIPLQARLPSAPPPARESAAVALPAARVSVRANCATYCAVLDRPPAADRSFRMLKVESDRAPVNRCHRRPPFPRAVPPLPCPLPAPASRAAQRSPVLPRLTRAMAVASRYRRQAELAPTAAEPCATASPALLPIRPTPRCADGALRFRACVTSSLGLAWPGPSLPARLPPATRAATPPQRRGCVRSANSPWATGTISCTSASGSGASMLCASAPRISPTGSGRITFAEAYWVVPENPHEGGAFYSPWFGIEVPSP